jgi:hypothetical protein
MTKEERRQVRKGFRPSQASRSSAAVDKDESWSDTDVLAAPDVSTIDPSPTSESNPLIPLRTLEKIIKSYQEEEMAQKKINKEASLRQWVPKNLSREGSSRRAAKRASSSKSDVTFSDVPHGTSFQRVTKVTDAPDSQFSRH